MARAVHDDDIDYCLSVGNMRGRATNPDGRRGQIFREFRAPPHWGMYLREQYGVTELPLPHRCGAFYVYSRASPDVGWEEVFSQKAGSEPEVGALDADAEVTIEALRESNAMVTQHKQEVAQLAARERQLQDQNSGAEAMLMSIRAEINACRALLASERERCARVLRQDEERLDRETASLDEMLRNRRAVAAAEEARIQAQVEAITMAAMKNLENLAPLSALFKSQVEERQAHLTELGRSIEDEIGAAKQVSARRHELQIALTRTQQAHLQLEEEKLDALDGLVAVPEKDRPVTAGDRLKDKAADLLGEIKPMELFDGIFGLLMKNKPPTE